MIIRMKRTQSTAIGTLRAGLAYELDPKNPKHKKVGDNLLKRKFAERVTRKQLDAEKGQAEPIAGAGPGQAELEAKAKADAEAKAEAEAEAKAKAAQDGDGKK